jgi:hypothetical protein
MIIGAHSILYSRDPEPLRAFLRDVLELESVDAGGGWLIFALPPGEVAVHPGDAPRCELYLMCDDIDATMADLRAKDVTLSDVTTERWGKVTYIDLPGGGQLGLYQPTHPTAIRR